LTKIEPPNGILSFKKQAQRIEENIEGCKAEKTNNI
jgi:hypothetical protein